MTLEQTPTYDRTLDGNSAKRTPTRTRGHGDRPALTSTKTTLTGAATAG